MLSRAHSALSRGACCRAGSSSSAPAAKCAATPSLQSLQSLIPKHAVSTEMVGNKELRSPQAPGEWVCSPVGRPSDRHLKL